MLDPSLSEDAMIQPARRPTHPVALVWDEALDGVPVVAIGAARPQCEALLHLLATLPGETQAACIVFDTGEGVTDSELGRLTPELLGRADIQWAQNGMALQPGAILLAPAASTVALAGGRITILPGGGPHALDAFAVSLSRSARPAVMVVMAAPGYAAVLGAAALRARDAAVVVTAEWRAGPDGWNLPDPAVALEGLAAAVATQLQRQTGSTRGRASPLPSPFHDSAEAEGLVGDLIGDLAPGRAPGAKLRAWVLGCGTGEAVYGLAVALRGQLAPRGLSLQVFATDVDSQALTVARAGRYLGQIAQAVPPAALERWFERQGSAFIVKPELRELCVFSAHNVLRDPAFSHIDLICCANALGELAPALQNRVLTILHAALQPDGALWLACDTTPPAALFRPVDGRPGLYRRAATPRPAPALPAAVPDWRRVPTLGRWRQAGLAAITAQAEQIAATHGPPFVVVDAACEVLHFSARIGRYLSPAPGKATLNLLQLVHPELRPSLATLLERVAQTGAPQTSRSGMETSDGRVSVSLQAEPIAAAEPGLRHVVVLLQDSAEPGAPTAGAREAELALGAAQEELRSLGEEFRLVSGELADRAEQLRRANSDLRNVLESSQVAIVFLDASLQVQSFTPASAAVIPLAATDIGRPVTHFEPRVDYPGLAQDAAHVLQSLATVEREVSARDGSRRYLVRMLPYRRVDNFIAGVVVTFLDVTVAFQAEHAMRNSEERFRMMAEVVPAFLFIADGGGAWQYVNPPFYRFTGLAAGAAVGSGWWDAIHSEDASAAHLAWADAIARGREIELELRLHRADGGETWFLLRAVPRLEQGAAVAWFGSCTDIDASRRSARRQRELLGELQHRVKNILAVVRSVVVRTVETSKTVDELSAHLSGRISAIARVQGMIARNAGNGVMLSELVDEELAAHGGHIDSQTEVSGPTVMLTGKAAEGLGLALHELTTNAIKFGAFAGASGRLRVAWRLFPLGVADPPRQRLVLEWQESGVPVTDLQPGRSGFGRELLESGLPYELGADTTLEFRPGGIRWVIQLEVADAQPAPSFAAPHS